jgi:hypothetical protein
VRRARSRLNDAEIRMLRFAPQTWELFPHFGGRARYIAATLMDWGYIETDDAETCWRRTSAGSRMLMHATRATELLEG